VAKRFWRILPVVACGAAAALLLWKLPQWQTAPWRAFLTPKDLLLVENELRQTLVLLLGAALIVGALAVLWRRIGVSERAAQASLATVQEAQRGERLTRAVGQLADERREVRVGAVYGLEQLAAESASQRGPIVEVLCAYLREHAAWTAERPQPPRLATDIQAVLTVLGRRARSHEAGERLDLRRVDLRGADLNDVHLERAILVEAHLENASLQNAHLESADLRGAYLAHVDAVGANLKGADLREAHLESAYLVEAHLEGADLGGAYLGGAYLGGAHLEGADLGGAHLDGAYLYKAHLEGASLHGARVVSTIGIHRDERERINRTAAPPVEEPLPLPARRKPVPVASDDEPISLLRRRRRG
jgi:hypothetical protein